MSFSSFGLDFASLPTRMAMTVGLPCCPAAIVNQLQSSDFLLGITDS